MILSSFAWVILVLPKQHRVIAVDATITHYHPGSITSSITPAAGIYTAITPDPAAAAAAAAVSTGLWSGSSASARADALAAGASESAA